MITRQPGNSNKKGKPYKSYKSSVRKLVRFFEQSRDRWKSKCKQAKRMVKYLKNRVRFLEKSRVGWKMRAKEAELKLVRLKAEQEAIEKELNSLKKMKIEKQPLSGQIEDFRVVPAHHQYSVGQVKLFISLVLSAAASLRCASSSIEIVLSSLEVPLATPCWSTGRLWLLRLGYYKLNRPKPKGEDWVWIVDHTIQLGQEKCLVILGVRLSDLPCDRSLEHKDVEAIALFPVKQSNGSVIYQQLEETTEKTGVPREIIADYGSDLKAGIREFCQVYPETDYIYDIKHKTATLLKHELQKDEAWLEFTRLASQTKSQVQQTALAPLAPPNQKSKARYMNLDVLIGWGQNILTLLEQQPERDMFDPSQVKEKFGWIIRFRPQLEEWAELFQIIERTESFVRKKGLYRGSCADLAAQPELEAHTERAKRVRQALLAFVAQEEVKAKPDERLLGSSEVLESIFGKLKRVERDQAKSGFSGLLLSVAAMVSTTTSEVVQKALETVPTKQVWAWGKEKLGQSIQAKRRAAFAFHKKTEQKRDQLCQPT